MKLSFKELRYWLLFIAQDAVSKISEEEHNASALEMNLGYILESIGIRIWSLWIRQSCSELWMRWLCLCISGDFSRSESYFRHCIEVKIQDFSSDTGIAFQSPHVSIQSWGTVNCWGLLEGHKNIVRRVSYHDSYSPFHSGIFISCGYDPIEGVKELKYAFESTERAIGAHHPETIEILRYYLCCCTFGMPDAEVRHSLNLTLKLFAFHVTYKWMMLFRMFLAPATPSVYAYWCWWAHLRATLVDIN